MRTTYYDYLAEQIESMCESDQFDPILYNLPKFFKLLCGLLSEDSVDMDARRIINSALAYFVVPVDVVPDDIYEGWGYMDDLFLLCYALRELQKYHQEEMQKNWDDTQPLDEALTLCIDRTEKFLDDKGLKEKVLRYAGLVD